MSSNNSPHSHPLSSAKVGLTASESTTFASRLRPSGWSLIHYNDWSEDSGSTQVALLIVLLSVAIYIPFLTIPLLPDDYLQATLARRYGPVSAWGALAKDPLYRSRATSLVITYWTETVFGFSRLAFGISSILLHAVNALLVYALGAARRIGWRLSALTAIFFVLQERYH